MGGHSLVADWVTDPAKPTVALRVDMDALPIHEVNDVPYRSEIPGVMHACGHDVHSAIGVGVAAVITALGDAVQGNIRILFQAEEEEITGALRMIRAGALITPKPIAIFGLHVSPFPTGKIAWTRWALPIRLSAFPGQPFSKSGLAGTPSGSKCCCRTLLPRDP